MKSNSLIPMVGILVILMITPACVKESDEGKLQIEAEIKTVTDRLHQSFFDFEILGGPETEIFQVENNGMNGIYGLTRDDTAGLKDDDQRLYDCIQESNPGLLQLLNLQTATNSFSGCRGNVSGEYIQEVAAVVSSREQERVILYGKFNAGELSAEEVNHQLINLKNGIRTGILEIKNKYSPDFRLCLHNYINDIQKSLNRSQWVTFKACV